ncbi:MAG: FkbM family methyltransferase [Alphaproteobacteria bacterium]|nr:FkbM family methyltransferase [Alphaproteobacteria bacterium]
MKASELALRIAAALPREDRARLALLLLEGEAEEITFRRGGTRWTAFPWDHFISEVLFVHGSFQAPELRALLAWLTCRRFFAAPRDVVIDLGANIGTSTIPIAQHTGCRVVAVEPVPEIFAVLCRNVADNGLAARVTCIQAAICKAISGRAQMILPERNGGGGEVGRPGREPSFAEWLRVRGTVDVPAIGLDDVLNAHSIPPDQVAFVWSDTQGCEAEVIETGARLWAAGAPLFVEFDPTTWHGSDSAAAVLGEAISHFVGFIPAEALIADAAAKPRPIAELADFSYTIGREGTDILLLPTFRF